MTSFPARLLDHAARVMPPGRRDWVEGMRAELAHIPTPLAATAFAFGCMRASYSQRIVEMMIFALLARWALALYALICAGCYLLATALLGAVKATPQITPQDLGSDPGAEESLRFIQGYPVWQLAAFLVIAALLGTGAVMLVRRKPKALPVLAAGVAAATFLAVLDLRLAGAADWPLAWSIPWLFPLLCLAPVWQLSRQAPDLRSA